MALKKTVKQFAFGEGIDTKPASEVTAIGKLHVLENARMDRIGVIQKKSGWTPSSTTVTPTAGLSPTTLPPAKRVVTHKESLFAICSNTYPASGSVQAGPEQVYKYNSSMATWGAVGTVLTANPPKGFGSCIATSSTVSEYTTSNQIPDAIDIAVIGNMACVIKHVTVGEMAICLVDLPSMEVITTFRPASASGIPSNMYSGPCRVIAFNSKFYVFYNPNTTNDLAIDEFDPATATRTYNNTLVTNMFNEAASTGTSCFFDIDVNPANNRVYLVYRDTGTQTRINAYSSLNPITLANTVSSALTISSYCTVYFSGTSTVISLSAGANTYVGSYTAALVAIQPLAIVFNQKAESITGSSLVFNGFTYLAISHGASAKNWNIRIIAWNATTGVTAISSAPLIERYVLAGRFFSLNGRAVLPYFYFGEDGSYQNTHYLGSVENSDATFAGGVISVCPISRMFYGEAQTNNTYISGSRPAQTLPSVQAVNGSTTKFVTTTLRNRQVFSLDPNDILRTSEAILFDFDDPVRYQDTENSNIKILTGSYNLMLDGQQMTELGFMNFPEPPILVETVGGSLTALGSYSYVSVWEWLDAEGNLHRSVPSIPAKIVLTGANQSVNVTIGTYGNTLKQGVRCRIYRTEASGTVYYGAANSLDAVTQTINDTKSDISLISSQILYATGGVLESDTLSGCRACATFKNRIFVVTDDGLFFSKRGAGLAPAEFSYTLQIPIESDGGPITAIAPLTDKLIIYKKDKAYFIAGDGPDNSGFGGSFSDPQLITGASGCVSHSAIVTLGESVMFKSRGDYWELNNGLATIPTGQELSNFFTESSVINKTLVLTRDDEVRIQTTSRCFVYNTFTKQWSIDPNYGGPSMCLWGSTFVFVNGSNAVCFEDRSVWKEGSSFVPLRAITSWLNLDAIEAYQRCYRLFLLLRFYTNHTLRVNVYYDYLPKVVDTFTFAADSSNLAAFTDDNIFTSTPYSGAGTSYMVRMHLKKQKCTAIRFEVVDESFSGSGRSMDITGFALELGLKSTGLKLPAAQST